MPNEKITTLDEADPPAGNEWTVIVQDGIDRKIQIDDFTSIERERAMAVEAAKADLLDNKIIDIQIPTGIARMADVQAYVDAAVAAAISALPKRIPIWTYTGTLALSESGRWYPEEDVTLKRYWCSLTTSGTGDDTILAVKKNGSIVDTITIPSGDDTAGVQFDVPLLGPENDYLTFALVQIDGVAGGLTIQPTTRFIPSG